MCWSRTDNSAAQVQEAEEKITIHHIRNATIKIMEVHEAHMQMKQQFEYVIIYGGAFLLLLLLGILVFFVVKCCKKSSERQRTKFETRLALAMQSFRRRENREVSAN